MIITKHQILRRQTSRSHYGSNDHSRCCIWPREPYWYIIRLNIPAIGTGGYGYGAKRYFEQYFNYVVADSFIDGGNRITRIKLTTSCKSLTKFIAYCCIEYTSPGARFELTTSVVTGTDYIDSCNSKYHTITTVIYIFRELVQTNLCIMQLLEINSFIWLNVK